MALNSKTQPDAICDEDLSDDLSVSATSAEIDSQDEWAVTEILAEAKVAGQTRYLMKWEGYDLSEASWEPADHLKEELLADWKAAVEQSGSKTVPGFKIRDWREAVNADIRAKYAKHEAKNRKRARLGLSQRDLGYTLQMWMDNVQGPSEGEQSNSDANNGEPASMDGDMSSEDEPLSTRSRAKKRETAAAAQSGIKPPDKLLHARHEQPQTSDCSNSLNRGSPTQSVLDRPAQANTANKSDTSLTKTQPMKRNARAAPKLSVARGFSNTGSNDGASTLNVFVGGKTRKPRGTLLTMASDTKRQPQLFNHRKRRILEKALRDKEGVTPPSQLTPSFFSVAPPITTNSVPEQSLPVIEQNRNLMSPSVPDQLSATKNKTIKRVRWAHDLDGQQQQVDEFDSLFVSEKEDSPGPETTTSTSSKRQGGERIKNHHPSASSPLSNVPPPRQIYKICQFGFDEGLSAKFEFSKLVLNDGYPWSRCFNDQSRLLFSHICTIQDLMSQTGHQTVQDMGDCQGTILACEAGQEMIESVAKRLQVGRFAAICHMDGGSVAIFTPETSQIINLANGLPAPAKDLAYLIFRSDSSSNSMLAPAPLVAYQNSIIGAYSFFLDGMYERPFKNSMVNGLSHNFFLMFPQTAYQKAVMISQWLQQADASCTVRTSLLPGHWSEFLSLDRGTVIFHEDAVWSIRSIPHLAAILHGYYGKIDFWVFSQSGGTLRESDLGSSSVDYRLRQIFQSGLVILITPSFLISQPEQAYNFVKFFWQNYTHHSSIFRLGKLAVCSDIASWLLDLAVEKDKATSQSKESLPDEQKRARAVEALFKCWNLIRQLIDETEDCDHTPFVYAPDVLDGNDEQSLVNWFGSWSLLHNQQFRKFLVLGSGYQTEARLSRNLRPVQFIKSRENVVCGPDNLNRGRLDTQQSAIASTSVVTNTASRIRNFLKDVERGYKDLKFCPIVLYRYPVTNCDSNTDSRLGDITSQFDDYRRWYSFFAQPLFARDRLIPSDRHLPYHKNTSVGLFYTHNSDGGQLSAAHKQQRQWSPWIAIYRPSDLQTKPWTSMELLIWDPNLHGKSSDSFEVYEEELTAPQQELIAFIREETRDLTTALPLERIWIGSRDDFHNSELMDPLDRTLSWIDSLSSSIKQCLPVKGRTLPSRGWKPVYAGAARTTEARPKSPSQTGLDSSSLLSLPTRTVFHAPETSVTGRTTTGRTTTDRNFFQEAVLQNQGLSSIPFTFQPTVKWYETQFVAGRGYQHIHAPTWQSFFSRHKIHDPEKG
ncbi:hypothetical protein QQS21_001109 [Conoideocrella luteorostrata]|uniref:Chromo domain-containing protein n=1 Tax=Conoideocrella luteorostrata TaxID=1105319 RepID=A0AAJ0D038_9HYPO|nr:hypothetical protein QQS21_001109 [Conoideocrella luteorostrata]